MTECDELQNEDWKITLRTDLIAGINGIDEPEVAEEVGYYYMCYAPTYLYKYYRDNSLNWDAVRNNKMWYSAPNNFNDVFDCDIFVDEKSLFNSILQMVPDKRGVRPGSPMWRQLKQTLNQEIVSLKSTFHEMKSTTGISCLSETCDSLLMWAHYANNHRGICVEYELLEINKQLGFSPVPIVYSDERSVFQNLNPDTLDYDVTEVFIKSLTSKSPEWSYEKEWRIIQDNTACGSKWDSANKGALINMITPSSIILGCMVNQDYEKSIYEYCKNNKINLFKMEKDKDFYRLNKVGVLEF